MRTALQDAMPNEAFTRGQRDRNDNVARDDCPYPVTSAASFHWRRGWDSRQREIIQAKI